MVMSYILFFCCCYCFIVVVFVSLFWCQCADAFHFCVDVDGVVNVDVIVCVIVGDVDDNVVVDVVFALELMLGLLS